MNFVERIQEQARESAESGAGIVITKEDYDEAVKLALEEMTDVMSSKGSTDVILPIIGLMFAGRIRTILFEEDK